MDWFSSLLEFLKSHGAPVVLLWAVVETDLVFLVVGALVHSGFVSPYTCFPAAVLGAMLHDTIVFWLARNRAEWVRKRKAYQNIAGTLGGLAKKTGFWQLSLCRPLYGTRYPSIIFWGLQHLSYPKFYAAVTVGLLPWAALLSTIGYTLFHYIYDFDDYLAEAKNWITGAVVVAVLFFLVRTWWVKKRRRASDAPQNPPCHSPADHAAPPPEKIS